MHTASVNCKFKKWGRRAQRTSPQGYFCIYFNYGTISENVSTNFKYC